MNNSSRSKTGCVIMLSDERWAHISDEHGELADWRADILGAVADPDRILQGSRGELLAVKQVGPGKVLVVVYRESEQTGFVITAFLTRRIRALDRRTQLWPPPTSKNS